MKIFKDIFIFDKNKFIWFKKTLLFNLVQVLHCWISISFFTITVISNPLILLILQLSNLRLEDYTLLIILIPLFFSFILTSILSFRLYSENRYNYIDSLQICKPVSKKMIFFARFTLIIFVLFSISTFYNLYSSIFLLAVGKSNLLYAMLVSNIFVTTLIQCLFISISVLISIKIKPNGFLLTSISAALLMGGISIIMRPFTSSNEPIITYDNENVSYTKIINENGIYYGCVINNQDFINTSPYNLVGNSNIANYFIPNEWILTFYNLLFNSFSSPYGEITNNSYYSLSNYRFLEKNKNDLDININNSILLRPDDYNLFSLNNIDGSNLIFNQIEDAITSSGLDINPINVEGILSRIKNEYIFNNLDNQIVNILKDFLGINTKYNLLYYFTKYYDFLSLKFTNLKTLVVKRYNESVWNLLSYLFSSTQTRYNLFLKDSDNILNTLRPLSYFYPQNSYIDSASKIDDLDKNFIKNNLVKFKNDESDNNLVSVLLNSNDTNSLEYSEFIPITKLNIDSSVIDKNSYFSYIDRISLRYDSTSKFIHNLKNTVLTLFGKKMYDFRLNNNEISLISYSYILELNPEPLLYGYSIIILILVMLILYIFYLSFRYYSKTDY